MIFYEIFLNCNSNRNDVLPVVMGARPEDYAAVAPPGSYIHVDDFPSPRHLAEYLHTLDAEDDKYNEYFRLIYTKIKTKRLFYGLTRTILNNYRNTNYNLF